MKNLNQKITTRKNGTLRVQSINEEPTMTQQQFKDECDINNIMKKYSSTGQFTHLTSKQGVYADFTMITDYREMLETVQYAQDAFMSLPAEMRKRFDNDPGKLLEFIQDSNNYEEALTLGLVNERPGKKPSETTIKTTNKKGSQAPPSLTPSSKSSSNSDDEVVE